MNPPRKHHYIPEFYTRYWTGDDGQLCQIARYRNGIIAPKRRFPGAVSFKYDLYTIPSLPPELASHLEVKYFRATDGAAAIVQSELASGNLNLSVEQRSSWVRFILSLLQRNPEKVAWILRVWEALHKEAHEEAARLSKAQGLDFTPLTEGQMVRSRHVGGAQVLQTLIELEETGTKILNMVWTVFELHEFGRLMTSDRPVVMTNGLKYDDSHIALALGPNKLFLAANSRSLLESIQRMGPREISMNFNDQVVRNAHRYVYACDDTQLKFVRNRLGLQPAQFISSQDLKDRFPPDFSI